MARFGLVSEQGTSSAARLARREMVQLIPPFFSSAALCKFLGDPSRGVNRSQQHAPTRSHEARATAHLQVHWRGLRPRVVAQRRRFAAPRSAAPRPRVPVDCRPRTPPRTRGVRSVALARPRTRYLRGTWSTILSLLRFPAEHPRSLVGGGVRTAGLPAYPERRASSRRVLPRPPPPPLRVCGRHGRHGDAPTVLPAGH